MDVLLLADALPTRHRAERTYPKLSELRRSVEAMTLPERLLAIHGSLDENAIPYAFGGAVALAYWTLDPRGTSDLHINVFMTAEQPEAALAALPTGVDVAP